MTKTHAENAPSDALTAWRKAFFTKDAKAFVEGFAENVVLAASALRKPVEQREHALTEGIVSLTKGGSFHGHAPFLVTQGSRAMSGNDR